ncbi:5-oxoprolinase subunit PxpB [Flammeovirga yaeyamensis]|uniref:5-oxoprolinase subunit PxpB n=1 Tax=Flammeovirga yaeyamensis TaxID=367791 RepID=A0AAX1N4V4_9BACT|nr:5-oxoprolinase subunit PxpB [Flammeovirga yaeyamensis]MBB3699840.1 inhibitor of KinA [Flammeovirga yaeyamensis]NMF36591.1 5-oxoprolinase subunit PxpB [Flammeovirga yaeyamensis]QWG02361.1 5-oxoprolinase subunit PxpB [Flammeovirga yaeyamensis]
MEIKQFGERALIIQFENIISEEVHQKVKAYYQYLSNRHLEGITSLIPAYTSITIQFDDDLINFSSLSEIIQSIDIHKKENQPLQRIVEIPVCYDTTLGLDLEEVSQQLDVSIDEIIELHTSNLYTVYMLGFSPGFMYLGGLDPRLFIPRKSTPRLKIPAGAVGLADQQTGIYPQATPGGWQIIGQTPLSIFEVNQPPKVKMGDKVKFEIIDLSTFQQLNQNNV